MSEPASQVFSNRDRLQEGARQVAVIVGASLFVALCARVTVPLPFTPVPLTLQNLAVLLVGLALGSRRGFTVLTLYLFEGLCGMPVFNPTGPGGLAQLLGPTGGFLLAYPFVAGLAGWIAERGAKTFFRLLATGFLAEVLLFVSGLTWLAALTHSIATAIRYGLYWFVFAEVIKIMLAAGMTQSWQRIRRVQA